MFLGIDIGTSAVKAVLVADDAVVAQSSAPLTVSRPHPLWSEQVPEAWWQATTAAVLALDPALRAGVQGIGLAGQMHGAAVLDAADRPLRPAILWNDGRSAAECAELEAAEPHSRAITGNIAMAGFTAPKLLWLHRHEPEVFAAAASVLLPKDYVRLRMTGDKASDMSDASGTLWLDVARRCWSPEMLAATGLSETQMPSLHEGPEITGALRAEVARGWGMGRVPVVAGAGDNAGAAVGLGVVHAGDAFLSLGTSGVLFVATDRFRPNADRAVHAFAHALPGRWHQMSVMLSAASCLDWAAALLNLGNVEALLALAETAEGDIPVFLPYLTGERTPHGDPFAQGVLFGLTAATGPAAIARAVLEGVALGLRDGLDALTAAGSEVGPIRMAGGGAHSVFWTRIIAAALDRPLILSEEGQIGPAFGAARLARLGITGEPVEAVCIPPADTGRIEPDPALAARLAERLPLFRQLYRDLRPRFAGILC